MNHVRYQCAQAPDVSLNFAPEYKTDPMLAGGDLTFRADVNYRSAISMREFETAPNVQKPCTLLGASVVWDSANQLYGVRPFGTNLTNEAVRGTMTVASGVGARLVTWQPPRQGGVETTARY